MISVGFEIEEKLERKWILKEWKNLEIEKRLWGQLRVKVIDFWKISDIKEKKTDCAESWMKMDWKWTVVTVEWKLDCKDSWMVLRLKMDCANSWMKWKKTVGTVECKLNWIWLKLLLIEYKTLNSYQSNTNNKQKTIKKTIKVSIK